MKNPEEKVESQREEDLDEFALGTSIFGCTPSFPCHFLFFFRRLTPFGLLIFYGEGELPKIVVVFVEGWTVLLLYMSY